MTNLKGSEKNLGNTPHSVLSDTTFFTMGQISLGGGSIWLHRNWEAKTLERRVNVEATPSQIHRNSEIPHALGPVGPATTVCLITVGLSSLTTSLKPALHLKTPGHAAPLHLPTPRGPPWPPEWKSHAEPLISLASALSSRASEFKTGLFPGSELQRQIP